MAPTNKNKILRDNDQDSDSDNEFSFNLCNNWPQFLVVESLRDDLPLSKLSPFAVQKWFQEVAGTLKSIKRLREGSFALGNCRRWVFSRPLDLLIDQHVFPSTKHWTHHMASSAAMSCLAWWRRKSRWNCRNRVYCSWGPQGDNEEGYWKGPHQHPVSDLQHSRPPKRDHGQLSKGEGGLVCSQPSALLQLQQVWPHEPTLQGCCEVSRLHKR